MMLFETKECERKIFLLVVIRTGVQGGLVCLFFLEESFVIMYLKKDVTLGE